MSENVSKCPRCGAALPPGPKAGPCPRCAAQFLQATQTEALAEPSGRRARFTPPPASELVSLFPQLEILELVGQGGMGAVYKARQKELDRIVALKVLPPDIGHDASFADRFAREAKALARLNHPGIVTLYEFGRAGGDTNREVARPEPLYYFLMEFVNGVNLRQVLEGGGRMSPREALAIVPQICDALQVAHDQGIVHWDIKPENILLDRQGHVKVADFGLAKLVGTAEAASGEAAAVSPASTGAGTVMGTPQYMAPEQRERPTEVDHRADIYSLGVVFYQMLTGELPASGKIEAPSSKVIVDVRLDEVVLRTLEREPERRYQHVSEVRSAVETIATTQRSADASAAPVDAASNAAARALPTAEFEHARQLVLIPAIGMMVVSSYTLAVAGFALLAWFGLAMNSGNPRVAPTPWPIVIPLLLVMIGCNITSLIGAHRMKQLRSFKLAATGTVLFLLSPWLGTAMNQVVKPASMLVSPVIWVIWMAPIWIFGIWSLFVLTRQEVREAFRSGGSVQLGTTPSHPGRTASRPAKWKPILAAGVLILAAAALGDWLLRMDDLRRSAESARIYAVNQRLTGDVRNHLETGGYGYSDVEVAVFSPGFPGGRCTIQRLRREQAEVEGGLNLRHGGSGIWFFNGWGALSNMQFQVDAAREMGLPLEQQLTFGPVIEQVVTGAIDFDKGKLIDLPLPPSANDREPARYDWLNSAEGKAWMRERGIDALDANRALIRVDMLLMKSKDQEWKSLTADALAAKIRAQAPATDVFNTRINTYGFQTREGREGMLQITGFTDNPCSVKIRYKLAQPSGR